MKFAKWIYRLSIVLALMICNVPLLFAAQSETQIPTGLWEGTIQARAGEVTFAVEIKTEGKKLNAVLINGTDRQPFSGATWDGQTLTLRMDYYDGQLTAHFVAPHGMEGEYSRLTSAGMVHIPATLAPRQQMPAGRPWKGPNLTGDWLLNFPDEQGAEKTPLATFAQQHLAREDGRLEITSVIEPVSGDTGLLHGTMFSDANGQAHFHLSRFDGIHVLALDGDVLSDGTLKGEMGGVKSLEGFTAERVKDVSKADPNALAGSLTRVKDPKQPFQFSGVDESGKTVDQTSPLFHGKAVIVDIFGTWCPNCHDEAPLLEKLYQKYKSQGLVIVGLAYEYSDDTQRDLRQIAIYRAKYGITFPLLLAGTTDKGQIEKTLPQLEHFGAYPTTIFLDRNGLVQAIHAGFAGPSTGERYQEVQQHMDELAREIVGR